MIDKNARAQGGLRWLRYRGLDDRAILSRAYFGLGFGCGLPYPLVGATLGLWFFESQASVVGVTILSWVLLPYSLKPLWAHWIDSAPLPVFGCMSDAPLSWVVWSQIGCFCSIPCLAWAMHIHNTPLVVVVAILVAFFGASQDAAVDAVRIRLADRYDVEPILLPAYQVGYRLALLVSDGLVLLLVKSIGWFASYLAASCLFIAPIACSLAIIFVHRRSEIDRSRVVILPPTSPLNLLGRVKLILISTSSSVWLFIAFYRLPDVAGYPMLGPSLLQAGISRSVISIVHMAIGLPFSLIGIISASLMIKYFGLKIFATVSAVIQAVGYYMLAICLFFVVKIEFYFIASALISLASSLTGIALVIFISRLAEKEFAAFDYAIFLSIYTFSGKILGAIGASVAQDILSGGRLNDVCSMFLAACGTMGIISIVVATGKSVMDTRFSVPAADGSG